MRCPSDSKLLKDTRGGVVGVAGVRDPVRLHPLRDHEVDRPERQETAGQG